MRRIALLRRLQAAGRLNQRFSFICVRRYSPAGRKTNLPVLPSLLRSFAPNTRNLRLVERVLTPRELG